MSTEKHTPGPWRIRTDLPQPVIVSESGQYVVAIPSEVNAARIVACVNAMEGIQNPKKFRENWEAVKHLELDKYHNLKEVIQNMLDRLDEGGEMTLTKDSIIVHCLKKAIK